MAYQWAVCVKNLEVNKVELVPHGTKLDDDDPRYENDLHVVPCTDIGSPEEMHLNFGAHDFTRQCYCKPEVREQVYGRTLIIHKGTIQ